MEPQISTGMNFSQGLLWLVVVAIVIVGGLAISKQNGDEAIKIGGAFGQTGICAEFGEGEFKAATLAIEEANKSGGVNGKQLQFFSEDTQCDNKTTVSAFQKLINVDKVVAIIGPTWGDSFQGGYPIAAQKQIVAVSPSTAIEALEITKQPTNFVFSTWLPQSDEIGALQKYALSKGLTKFVIVHDQDPFGAMMANLFQTEASRNGISIIEEHTSVTGTNDFKTIIARVKIKAPPAIFVSFLGPDSKAIFLKQARDLGIQQTVFSSADIQNPSLLASFASALEGVIYTYPETTGAYGAFAEKYKSKYGKDPEGPSAANAYDAVRAVIETLKRGARSGDEIQAELLKFKIPGTIVKELQFTDKHQISDGEFEIKTIKNGQFVSLEE